LLALARRMLKPGGKFLGDILQPELHASLLYPNCGWRCHTVDSLQAIAQSEGLAVRCLGGIRQFQYPAKLSLSSNLMLEFTRKSGSSGSRPAIIPRHDAEAQKVA